jgi:hypothetical protein
MLNPSPSTDLLFFFRAYRRAGSVEKVNDLISRVQQEGLVLKPDVEDEIEKWLEKKCNQ